MDAFHSPKFPPLAILGVGLSINEHLAHAPPRERFEIRKAIEIKSAFLRIIPGYNLNYLLHTVEKSQDLQAVVLELPHSNPILKIQDNFVDLLRRMIDANLCVIIGSQCPVGRLTSSEETCILRDMGVVFARDMTMEAVSTKLAYAYGRGLTVPEIRSLMETNIRGELTEEK